ncbi:glycogen debranching N-terminal domain-containing protein [Micromonospora citrea]|uniref:amylo-alpha-1,6-glucosidase n=1 Tax=Micromonospora citrea TaxID=47855 RepID=UPI003C4DE990
MSDLVRILDGNSFVVTDRRGDFSASPTFPTGLFSWDTRFLSKWQLTVNGRSLYSLSLDDLQYYQARFFLAPASATHDFDSTMSIIRQQTINDEFEDQLTIISHGDEPTDLVVRLDVASDFADIFEIRHQTKKKGGYSSRIENGNLFLGYQREDFHREVMISCDLGSEIDPSNCRSDVDLDGLTATARLEPKKMWVLKLRASMLGPQRRTVRASLGGTPRRRPPLAEDLELWFDNAPRLETDHESLIGTYRRSIADLAALRYTPLVSAGLSVPAAGLPWFMTIFGRDSIITSFQALPFAPQLAAATIYTLSIPQGSRLDDFRDEEPGKILHEFRYGESAAFEEQPHTPYYGSADATPLYVVLMDEYERWTGDATMVHRFEREARAALDWIDTYGDAMGNGYIWYQRRSARRGLQNQCWKDSDDGICYRDGRLPGFPRATCELQGYAYDAKIRGARLAREFWGDPAFAERLEREAADLKARFNRDFWIERHGYYALALDANGDQVDALTSNIGHLLWSGIVDESRADEVARHLMSPELFSGWGVRTLATDQARYNPIGYHIGTVWPFDNSLIAWGLRRYGFDRESARIAIAIIEAAGYFAGRLPEAFGGYERDLTRYPVEYPTACSPQAWSAGTTLLLLRAMLGLEPVGDHLVSRPSLPDGLDRLVLHNVPGRWGRKDISA